MVIIHGENTALSRKKLQELIEKAKQSGLALDRLEAKKLTPAILQENLGSSSLFGDEKVIIIEELHSLPTSKRKKELIETLSTSSDVKIILYEKKKITTTMIKKLGQSEVFEFKISNSLWELLDKLGSNDKKNTLLTMRKAISQNDEFFVYTMIIRQIRILITAKDGGVIKGAPFMVSKLKSQANQFSLEQLLKIHHQLHLLDIKQKNSQLYLNLSQELDLLLFKM
jgi:DNA polymerase III delta subunit